MSYTKEQRIVNQSKIHNSQPLAEISEGMVMPNHSGIASHPEAKKTFATIDYVDDEIITDHTDLTNIGTNTHAQIDTHIGDHSDPHGASLTQSIIITPNHIFTTPRSWSFSIGDPHGRYDIDTQIFIAWVPYMLTITKIQIELDASTNQVQGDLKYANDFLSLASPQVINDFDTTNGKRTDTTITNGIVPTGKAIYLQFDSQPHKDIKQMHVQIDWKY